MPYAYRVTLYNLTPNATYNYINGVVISGDVATSSGAGNAIYVTSSGSFVRSSGPTLNSAGNFGTFTTDGTGSYTGWFITEPTGNATRFAIAGTQVYMRIILNDGAGGTTSQTFLTTANFATVTVFNTTSAANTGTAIRGSSAAAAKNFAMLYDNIAGTGRPIAGTLIEADGAAETTANSYASFYGTSVDEVAGAWGCIIPNSLANGIRRIENRAKANGSLVAVNTDSDGVWPSGANTVNPAGGDTTPLVITATDAPLAPVITASAALTGFTTTYGTASVAQSFSVSSANLTANLTATAPTGFEVSSDATTYSSSATFTQSGGTASGTLSVRLAATATVTGSYNSQNIALTSSGATTVNITTAASGNSVTPKALTITGLLGSNKVYDGLTNATFAGTAAYVGLTNGESFTVSGSPNASFGTATVGNNKAITVTGYTAPSANYSLVQPTLTANVTPATLTVTANNTNRIYGAANPTFIVSYSGFVNNENIGLLSGTPSLTTTAAPTSNVGTYPIVATNGSLSAVNYTFIFVNGKLAVTPAASTLVISSSANPVGYLDAVSFTGTVSTAATGNLIFLAGNAPFSTNTIGSGSATSSIVNTLPRGANTITAIYSGDGNFFSITNSLTQTVTNHPPIAVNLAATRATGSTTWKIAVSDLLTNATDVDADTISLISVSASTNGATPFIGGGYVLYTNTNLVGDQFAFNVSDGFGGTASAVVNLAIGTVTPNGQAQSIAISGGTAMLQFAGIPGFSYNVQRTTNLVDWTTILTTNPVAGVFQFTDDFSDLGGAVPASAYYRLGWNQ